MPSPFALSFLRSACFSKAGLRMTALVILLSAFGTGMARAEELSPFEASVINAAPDMMLLIKAEFPADYVALLTAIGEARQSGGDLKTLVAGQIVALRTRYAEAVFQAEDEALREVVAFSHHLLETIYASEGAQTCGMVALGGPTAMPAEAIARHGETLRMQPVILLRAIASGRKNGVQRDAASEADWGEVYTEVMDTQPPSVVSAIIDADPTNPELCIGMIGLVGAIMGEGKAKERVRADFVHELAISPVSL